MPGTEKWINGHGLCLSDYEVDYFMDVLTLDIENEMSDMASTPEMGDPDNLEWLENLKARLIAYRENIK